MDDRAAGKAILNVSTKLDRIIEATAETLAHAIEVNEYEERSAVQEIAKDLADAYARIDPTFNRALFLNIADPD